MKPFIIALTLYLFVNISSCSTNDAPIVEPPNGETAEDSNTPTMNEQIRIIIGNASFTATLEDNATTKAFKASLPITVNMTEQAGNEKFYYLPTALPTSTVTPGTIFAGDLMLWATVVSSCSMRPFPVRTAIRESGKSTSHRDYRQQSATGT